MCALLCAATAFAEDRKMPPVVIPTAASNGMGGSHIAYTDTVFALLVNPAAIMRVEQKSTFSLSPSLFNPKRAYDLAASMADIAIATYKGDYAALTGVMDVFSGDDDDTPVGFDLREFPFALAWVADGLGVGLWSRAFMEPSVGGAISLYGDVIMPIGFAMKILETNTQSVDVGITLKPFARVMVHGRKGEWENFSVPVIAGTGFDVGFMYRWDLGLNAGFTLSDIITRGKTVHALRGEEDDYSYYVPFTMNLGLAYDFKIGNFWADAPEFLGNTGIAFAVDWRDIANTFQQGDGRRDFLLDLSAGIEVTLFNMLMLRTGMNQLRPAYGIGVNLGLVQIDAAYYEKEFGTERGQLSAPMVDLTIAVRAKAKERNWSWTERSILGFIAKSDTL